MPAPGIIQSKDAASVGSHKPFVADRRDGRNPVVPQRGILGSVARAHDAAFENGKTPEGADEQSVSRARQRVGVVVDQALEGVQAPHFGCVDKGEPGRRGHGHALGIERNIRNMVGDQSLRAPQHLSRFAPGVKEHETVCGGHGSHIPVLRADDAVNAEKILVFVMGCASAGGIKNIQAPIEITDPHSSGSVDGQRRDVPIGQQGFVMRENLAPLPPAVVHCVQPFFRERQYRPVHFEETLHRSRERLASRPRSARRLGNQRNLNQPLLEGAREKGVISHQQRPGKESGG